MRKLQNGMLYSKNESMHFSGNVLILLLCVDSQCLSYYMSEHMKILHTFFSMHQLLHNKKRGKKERNSIIIINATPWTTTVTQMTRKLFPNFSLKFS